MSGHADDGAGNPDFRRDDRVDDIRGSPTLSADATLDHLCRVIASAVKVRTVLVSRGDVRQPSDARGVGLPTGWTCQPPAVWPAIPDGLTLPFEAPLAIEDIRDVPAPFEISLPLGVPAAGLIVAPIGTANQAPLGAIWVVDERPRRWTDDEVSLVENAAAAAGAAIELADAARNAAPDLIRASPSDSWHDRAGFRLLARVGDLLSASLDYQTTLSTAAHLAVPAFADWCEVYARGDGGAIQRVALAHADADEESSLRDILEHTAIDPAIAGAITSVAETGRSILEPEITEELLAGCSLDFPDYPRRLGLNGAMIVPLVGRDRILGAMAFVSGRSRRRYDRSDLALAEAIARRVAAAIDNAELYRRAQDALDANERTLATVFHDLRAPLGNIKGYAQFLRGLIVGQNSEQLDLIVKSVERIDTIATRMAGMIDDMIETARVHLGRERNAAQGSTDLVELARQVCEQFQGTSDRHPVRLLTTVRSAIGPWGARQLELVVVNLVANAIKYSPNGGEITLTVGREDEGDRSWAVLQVSDQGIGIPTADLPHIFEEFRRASNVVGRFDGTGLGLASATRIVNGHGGQISARSKEGVGSTFTVRLPLPSAPPTARVAIRESARI